MTNSNNKAPKGVIFAFAMIILMIIIYFVLTSIFPEIFSGMNTGTIETVKD